jgi:hypothetical protein
MDLDLALTYAIDLTMALGAGYIGTSFVLYMARRWPELGRKTRVAQPVNIPLKLKAAETVPLELEQPEKSVITLPEPLIPSVPQPPEIATAAPVSLEDVPEIPAASSSRSEARDDSVTDEPVDDSISDDSIVADLFPFQSSEVEQEQEETEPD